MEVKCFDVKATKTKKIERHLLSFSMLFSHASTLVDCSVFGAGCQRDELGLWMAPGSQVFHAGAQLVVHNEVRRTAN